MNTYYLVFAGDHYYPVGGIDDLASAPTPTLGLAIGTATRLQRDWWHIVEVTDTGIREVKNSMGYEQPPQDRRCPECNWRNGYHDDNCSHVNHGADVWDVHECGPQNRSHYLGNLGVSS